jgi:hypothetical protein
MHKSRCCRERQFSYMQNNRISDARKILCMRTHIIKSHTLIMSSYYHNHSISVTPSHPPHHFLPSTLLPWSLLSFLLHSFPSMSADFTLDKLTFQHLPTTSFVSMCTTSNNLFLFRFPHPFTYLNACFLPKTGYQTVETQSTLPVQGCLPKSPDQLSTEPICMVDQYCQHEYQMSLHPSWDNNKTTTSYQK